MRVTSLFGFPPQPLNLALRAAAAAAFLVFAGAPAAEAGGGGACCYNVDSCASVGSISICSVEFMGLYKGDGTSCSSPGICAPVASTTTTMLATTTSTMMVTTTTMLPLPVCGNQILEDGEQCDDGNTQSGDGCSPTCQNEYCGDGVISCFIPRGRTAIPLQFCEQCDDGNTATGDGCGASCRYEICGNGILDPGEQCDDGNTANGDTCDANCTYPACGNTIIDPKEQCDDGNTAAGDGCSPTCMTEGCGNSFTDPGEQCDDGNTTNGDGCDNNCTYTACGNGITACTILQSGRNPVNCETCDDGNTASNDGCSDTCQVEFCGDNVINNVTEQCDDGNTDNSDSCVGCQNAACGDGYIHYVDGQPVEACDDGNTASGDGCSSECVAEYCGDGIVNNLPPVAPSNVRGTPLPEQCDDGNTDQTDACLNNCQFATCGDGIVNISNGKTLEQCDDGNTQSNDGCTSSCTLETGACCYGALCVDGEGITAESCSSNYKGSYAGTGTTCQDAGVCVNCGDGNLQFGEECDDGNSAAADGCSDICAVEDCYSCNQNKGYPASICSSNNDLPCDDGELCTLGDHCNAGHCVGSPPVIPAACHWVEVAGSPSNKSQVRLHGNITIIGDSCGQQTRVGEGDAVLGDVVATGSGGKKISQCAPLATVSGDIITGGAAITGRPDGVLLPGLATSVVAGGTATVQSGDATRDIDATGTSPLALKRVGECKAAIDGIVPATALINSMLATDVRGDVKVPLSGSLTLDATSALNVIDFKTLITGNMAKLTLDGHNFPNVVFVLRVDKKMYFQLLTDIEMVNGAAPERVLVMSRGVCKVGQRVTGGGTLFCPNKKMKIDQYTQWQGALVDGSKRIDLRYLMTLTHAPLLIGAH